MSNIKYYVEDFLVKKIRFYPDKKQKKTNIVYFNSFEEAKEDREKQLIEMDTTFDFKRTKSVSYGKKISLPEKNLKSYMYNVLQYQHRLIGFTFNIGIVIWNKETNEISYKFIEKKYLNKLIKIMPNLKFINHLIENVKTSLSKIENTLDLKSYIVDYKVGYAFEHGFQYNIGSSFLDYNDVDKINRTIEENLEIYYNDYIGIHFEKENN